MNDGGFFEQKNEDEWYRQTQEVFCQHSHLLSQCEKFEKSFWAEFGNVRYKGLVAHVMSSGYTVSPFEIWKTRKATE